MTPALTPVAKEIPHERRQPIRSRVVFAALVAVTAIALACGDDAVRMMGDAMVDVGTMLSDAGRNDAAAQPSACVQWEARRTCSLGDPGCTLPAGFQPFAVEDTGTLIARRCVE